MKYLVISGFSPLLTSRSIFRRLNREMPSQISDIVTGLHWPSYLKTCSLYSSIVITICVLFYSNEDRQNKYNTHSDPDGGENPQIRPRNHTK